MAANAQPRPDSPAAVTTKPRRNFTKRSSEAELVERRAEQKWDADDGHTVVCFMDKCGIHLRELGSRPKPLKNHLLDKHGMTVAQYKDHCESQGWGRPRTTSLYARTNQHTPRKSETKTPGRQLKRSSEAELAEIHVSRKWDAPDGRTVICLIPECGIWMQNLGNRRCELTNHLLDKHGMTVAQYKDHCESQGWGRPPTTALCARQPELTDEEKALRIRCPVKNANGRPCGALLRNLSVHVVKVHQMPIAGFSRLHPDVPLCIPSIAAGSRSRLEAVWDKQVGIRQAALTEAQAEVDRKTEELARANEKLQAAEAVAWRPDDWGQKSEVWRTIGEKILFCPGLRNPELKSWLRDNGHECPSDKTLQRIRSWVKRPVGPWGKPKPKSASTDN